MISTASNYEAIMQTITGFDNILSGTQGVTKAMPSTAVAIMNHLLYDKNKDKFHPFIYESFSSLLDQKTEIKLDMPQLHKFGDRSFVDSIFAGSGLRKYKFDNKHQFDNTETFVPFDYSVPSDGDNTNILKLSLLTQLKNLESISIENVESTFTKGDYWPFSLLSLSSILPLNKIREITVKASKGEVSASWLSSIWEREKVSLQQAYHNKEYAIDFQVAPRHRISIKPIALIVSNIIAGINEILSGGKNYHLIKSAASAISTFDYLLHDKTKSAESATSILDHLLTDTTQDKFPSSIYESFQEFLDERTDIKIDLDTLLMIDNLLLNWIFGENGWRPYINKGREYDAMNEDDFTNILKLSLVKQCKNLKSMTITNKEQGDGACPISLLALLSILDSTTIRSIDITVDKFIYVTTGLELTWKKYKESLQHAYENKRCSINFHEEQEMHHISIGQSI